jgi:hypothetical protein
VHDTIHKFQPDKSVMAEHCTDVQHNTNFKATTNIMCSKRIQGLPTERRC